MSKFKVKIKEAIKVWNSKNPHLRQKNIKTLADEIGVNKNYISVIGKRFVNQFEAHFEVILNSDDKEIIKLNWNEYLGLDIILINRLEAIRVALECEIWDLVTKIKE